METIQKYLTRLLNVKSNLNLGLNKSRSRNKKPSKSLMSCGINNHYILLIFSRATNY